MLALQKRPLAVEVALGHGAMLRVRPASVMEVERAGAEVSRLILGLIAGAEAAMVATAALGEDFAVADFNDQGWIRAASTRLSLLKLAVQCCESWEGVGDENGEPLELNEGNLAVLLRDPAIARQISNVIEASVHREAIEKKDLPNSPDGAAAAAAPIAPNAGAPENPAPTDGSVPPASAARS